MRCCGIAVWRDLTGMLLCAHADANMTRAAMRRRCRYNAPSFAWGPLAYLGISLGSVRCRGLSWVRGAASQRSHRRVVALRSDSRAMGSLVGFWRVDVVRRRHQGLPSQLLAARR